MKDDHKWGDEGQGEYNAMESERANTFFEIASTVFVVAFLLSIAMLAIGLMRIGFRAVMG